MTNLSVISYNVNWACMTGGSGSSTDTIASRCKGAAGQPTPCLLQAAKNIDDAAHSHGNVSFVGIQEASRSSQLQAKSALLQSMTKIEHKLHKESISLFYNKDFELVWSALGSVSNRPVQVAIFMKELRNYVVVHIHNAHGNRGEVSVIQKSLRDIQNIQAKLKNVPVTDTVVICLGDWNDTKAKIPGFAPFAMIKDVPLQQIRVTYRGTLPKTCCSELNTYPHKMSNVGDYVLSNYECTNHEFHTRTALKNPPDASDHLLVVAKVRLDSSPRNRVKTSRSVTMEAFSSNPTSFSSPEDQTADVWYNVVHPLLEQDRKVGLLYSANNRQAESIIDSYGTKKVGDISGSGQAILFRNIANIIDGFKLWDRVHILPVSTSMSGGNNLGDNRVSLDIINRDLRNIREHVEQGWDIRYLSGNDKEFSIGGGISKGWYNHVNAGIYQEASGAWKQRVPGRSGDMSQGSYVQKKLREIKDSLGPTQTGNNKGASGKKVSFQDEKLPKGGSTPPRKVLFGNEDTRGLFCAAMGYVRGEYISKGKLTNAKILRLQDDLKDPHTNPIINGSPHRGVALPVGCKVLKIGKATSNNLRLVLAVNPQGCACSSMKH